MYSRARQINRRKSRGIVLPTVLWIAILVITVGVNYASAVHVNIRATDNIETALMLKHDAISGVYLALDRVLENPPYETTHYRLQFNRSQLDVEVSPEHLKTNLNTASADELRYALAEAGFGPERARMLAARIIDWRDPDHQPQPLGWEDADYFAAGKGYGARDGRFKDLSELLLIDDLKRNDFTRLARHVSLYGSPISPIYSITASSSRVGSANLYVTTAIVRITRQPTAPYQVVKWHHHNG
jgi:general secretion pathway protein K